MPGIDILRRYTGAILRHSETADTIAEWLTAFDAVGAEQGYTTAEIAEYGAHLRHIAAVLEMRKQAMEVTA